MLTFPRRPKTTTAAFEALAAPRYHDGPARHLENGALPRVRRLLVPACARAAAVALPVLMLAYLPDSAIGLHFALAAAAIWFIALKSVFLVTGMPPLAIDPLLAPALGTVLGLVGVAAADDWLSAGISKRSMLLAAAGVFASSSLFELLVAPRLVGRQRVMVVGSSEPAAALIEELAGHGTARFECLGTVADDRDAPTVADAAVLGSIDELEEVVARARPDIVVLANHSTSERVIGRLLDSPAPRARVVGLVGFYEHAFGRVPVEHLSPGWFMAILHIYQRPYSRFSKRAFDLTLALTGVLVAVPLVPLIALGVRLSGHGPILYRQTRLGEGGRLFQILKFRTMHHHAEDPAVPVWAAEGDRRVTPFGSFLRRTRLDELPQLWNVIRGEMSIVGPRPERPEFLATLQAEVPFWTRRHLVKPGLSGWAQVRRGYTADVSGTREKLAYDLYYLRHRSLLLDLMIAIKTAWIVVRGSGAR